MKLDLRFLLFGFCLPLIGGPPAGERIPAVWGASPAGPNQAASAWTAAEDGRLSVQADGRRFQFGEGQLAVSTGESSWSYRFQGSRGGIRALSISTLPEKTAEGSLQYRHVEGIIERYLVQSRGIEQQFVLPGPYASGDVLLTGSVATDLVPDKTSSFEGIAFQRDGETALFYGEAKAVDAAGSTALLEERWADGELTIVVPASFLAAARFPVLVDPYIGSRTTVDSAVDLAQNPAVATTGSAAFKALAVWSTNATSPQSIRGRIIGPRGITLVGPISAVDEFNLAGTTYTRPRVAWSAADGVWVVAAEGHGAGVPNPDFIQVNQISILGTKTTGTNLNAVGAMNLEQDVDVACNNAGLCLITWVVDRDNNGTSDSVKGVFYTPASNTFGSIVTLLDGAVTRSHSRVASNGTDFYEVNAAGPQFIEGYSISAGGTVVATAPSQSGSVEKANPDVSYNAYLAKYLVAWDTGSGNTIRGSTLSNATPPVPSGSDALIFSVALNPQIASQDWRGWSMIVFEPGGPLAATILVRPNLTYTDFVVFDSSVGGSVASADVAHFYRGLSIAVWEDTLGGSMTDHDIWAREFLPPSMEYADFDNNGWASAFVWRPGSNAYFYYSNDLLGAPPATSVQFGTNGDIPVRTDLFGSGLPDLAVFRPSNGFWYIDTDRNGTANVNIQFGAPGDIPVPGDYDMDGYTDVAVFRPSNGTWYIRFSASGLSTSVQFGAAGDIPVPADYNGDFRTDLAVWRPSTGNWYVDTDLNGTVDINAQFGTAGDIPVPGDYGPSNVSNAPDGLADFAVFRPSSGYWYVSRNRNGVVDLAVQFGASGDIPVGGVYDSNPIINSPFAVFRPSNGTWYVDPDNNGTVDISSQFGTFGDIPMQQSSGQYRN
jgi:hypothetical protein